MVKNKGFKVMYFCFILLFMADVYTTWLNRDILQYTELNPLYGVVGLAGIIGWNITIIYILRWLYPITTTKGRYALLLSMFIVNLFRVSAIRTAWEWYNLEPVNTTRIAVAQAIPKQAFVAQQSGLLLGIPIIIILFYIVFLLWHWDHEVKKC